MTVSVSGAVVVTIVSGADVVVTLEAIVVADSSSEPTNIGRVGNAFGLKFSSFSFAFVFTGSVSFDAASTTNTRSSICLFVVELISSFSVPKSKFELTPLLLLLAGYLLLRFDLKNIEKKLKSKYNTVRRGPFKVEIKLANAHLHIGLVNGDPWMQPILKTKITKTLIRE